MPQNVHTQARSTTLYDTTEHSFNCYISIFYFTFSNSQTAISQHQNNVAITTTSVLE